MALQTVHQNCSGCRACLVACGLENLRQVNPAMAALAVEGRFPAPGDYRLHVCDQCGDCADACPEEAINQVDGAWLIDPDLCTNCEICVEACPHGVMFTHALLETPIKCTLCGVCAEICPRDALVLDSATQGGA